MNLAVGVLLYIPVCTTDLVVLGLVLVAVCIGSDLTEAGVEVATTAAIMIALNLRNFILFPPWRPCIFVGSSHFFVYSYVSFSEDRWQGTYSVLFLTKKSQDLDNQSSGIFRSATRIRTWE